MGKTRGRCSGRLAWGLGPAASQAPAAPATLNVASDALPCPLIFFHIKCWMKV